MTRDGEIMVLSEHLATSDRLASRLTTVRARIERLIPLTADSLSTLGEDDDINILAFLKTFGQFEDTLGRTLKTIAILMHLGKVERLAARDVALRAVALGVFDDAKAWADAVRVRNELAHEYPLRPDRQALQVNAAWDKSGTLFETAQAIAAFVKREGLLDGNL